MWQLIERKIISNLHDTYACVDGLLQKTDGVQRRRWLRVSPDAYRPWHTPG
jgi:hypothetical protein